MSECPELPDRRPLRMVRDEGMSGPTGPMLRIDLLGGFRVAVDGATVDEAEWRLRSARGLIKLLALAPEHSLHREHVVEALLVVVADSAGSWPVTSTTAISIQTATNSATAPVITRRRIVRTRAAHTSLARALAAGRSELSRCGWIGLMATG